MVENIATLMEPPASDCTESDWVSSVVASSGCDLLLDLHNLHANGINFGFDPIAYLDRLDPERIGAIHLAGGSWIDGPPAFDFAQAREGGPHVHDAGGRRYLDDHLHDVPDPVYALLTEVGARVPRPLTVVLERDGRFPPMHNLLNQLDRARAALAEGRARFPIPRAQSPEPKAVHET
jgi:uncharacterized protein (UPF0276 family)